MYQVHQDAQSEDSFAVVVGGDDGEGDAPTTSHCHQGGGGGEGDAPTTSQLEPVDDGCDGGGGTGS